MRAAAGVLVALTVGNLVVACDPGTPSAAEQMSSLGLPVDSALRVDDDTLVTVDMGTEGPELLIYTPYRFGGDQVTPWPAGGGSIGDGMYGSGNSAGPWDEERREYMFINCYVFGAGQGPIEDIVLSNPAARWQIVNPEIDGWVVTMPDEEDAASLEWQLIGTDGVALHVGRGFPGSHACGSA